MYPESIVKPMKQELVSVGFEDLTTPDAVNAAGLEFQFVTPCIPVSGDKPRTIPTPTVSACRRPSFWPARQARSATPFFPPGAPVLPKNRQKACFCFLECHPSPAKRRLAT